MNCFQHFIFELSPSFFMKKYKLNDYWGIQGAIIGFSIGFKIYFFLGIKSEFLCILPIFFCWYFAVAFRIEKDE